MENIYLLENYNNYANRLLRRKFTLEDILSSVENYQIINANFNPNDGIHTNHVFNYRDIEFTPDYLIVCNENNEILSKWFVTEAVRLRNKQYNCTLKRDVLNDYFENIKDLKMFVEKGMLNNDNPLIFNKELISFNRIKQEEHLLQDETKNKWIVGYISKEVSNTEVTGNSISGKVTEKSALDFVNWNPDGSSGRINVINGPLSLKFSVKEKGQLISQLAYKYWYNIISNDIRDFSNSSIEFITRGFADGYCFEERLPDRRDETFANKLKENTILKSEDIGNAVKNIIPLIYKEEEQTIINLRDQIIYDSSVNKYYRLSLVKGKQTSVNDYIKASGSSASLHSLMSEIAGLSGGQVFAEYAFAYEVASTPYDVYLTEVTNFDDALSVTLHASRNKLYDAPYDMFAIPYSLDNLNLAHNIANELANSIYDLQILPYCPRRDLLVGDNKYELNPSLLFEQSEDETFIQYGEFQGSQGYDGFTMRFEPQPLRHATLSSIDVYVKYVIPTATYKPEDCRAWYDDDTKMIYLEIDDSVSPYTIEDGEILLQLVYHYSSIFETLDETKDFEYIKLGQTNVSFLLWCNSATLNFVIPFDLTIPDLKISNETEMYRLVSPNYNGIFEFSASKNKGISGFNVYATYKPYQPFINIAPAFTGLYGQDFNDARGLICNGDFSVAMTSSSWANYENNNKNYENIFNTQIKTMDKAHNLSMLQQGIELVAGNAIDMFKKKPSAYFDVAMGVEGMAFGQAQFELNRSLQIANYGYNLQNIQATPDSLIKVSAYNIANKYFPFLEIYRCTEEEVEILKNKINFDGMTVMSIYTMSDFLEGNANYDKNFFKAQFISALGSNIKEDSHLILDIAEELSKGIYIGKENE